MDGKDVLRRAREFYQGPIIILSARDREAEKIAALDLGANDYVEKPFGVGELLARIRAGLRQGGLAPVAGGVVTVGEVVIDLDRRIVTRAGERVKLRPKEYEVLACLARNAGKVLGHADLLKTVWGAGHAADVQYLRVVIGQLRHKLEADPGRYGAERGIPARTLIARCRRLRRLRRLRRRRRPSWAGRSGRDVASADRN